MTTTKISNNIPIAWTIAGSDSGGGAGMQADIASFRAFDVHGCTIVTAVTAQNTVRVDSVYTLPASIIERQLQSLADDLPAKAIKLGVLADASVIKTLITFLQQYTGWVVYDPVLVSTSGDSLLTDQFDQSVPLLKQYIFPQVDLLTPNLHEAQVLTGLTINHPEQMIQAAARLLELGVKAVLLKGGHLDSELSQDYFTDGERSFWLNIPRCKHQHTHGSGCTLSAAITACLARGYSMDDALVLGKMYVSQGIRTAVALGAGPGPVAHGAWPTSPDDLPWMSECFDSEWLSFPSCGPTPLGLYPLVDSAEWLARLLPLGVSTIQLRIKNKSGSELEKEIATSVKLARRYHARLFVNDYWELAIKYGAYGVHLGQEDLTTAQPQKIAEAGLRLGVSTYGYAQVARAHGIRPSYIACGPIFPTESKVINKPPLGLQHLSHWVNALPCPVVAIGGINQRNLQKILSTGVDGVALIAAITQAQRPSERTRYLLDVFESCRRQRTVVGG